MEFTNKRLKRYLLSIILIVGNASLVSSYSMAENGPYHIGIHIWKSGKIYDEALQGIRDGLRLEEFEYKETLLFAGKNKNKAIDNFNKLDNMSLDIIFSLSSAGTKIAKDLNLKTPIISTVVNHPVSLGVNSDKTDLASKITGTSYYVDANKQLEFYRSLFPKVKMFGMILDKNNPAGYLAEEPLMRKACNKAGIKFHSIAINNKSDLVKATNYLIAENVKLIIIPTNRIVYKNLSEILEVTHGRRIPVVSMSKQGVENGALAGLFADTYKLGRYTTEMVKDIVLKKKDILDIPFRYIDSPNIAISLPEATKLDYEFPPEVLGAAEFIVYE